MYGLYLHLNILKHGEMPERSNGTVSKTVVLVTVPRVRIPLSPQKGFDNFWKVVKS
jgi:hypothetical protein